MVMFSGRSGRPTAGLTWASNNMCHLLWKASGERLLPERVYIAPHAPSLVLADIQDEDHMRRLGAEFRDIWNNTRASVELARGMFEGFRPSSKPCAPHRPSMPAEQGRPRNAASAFARRPFHRNHPLAAGDGGPAQLLANSVARTSSTSFVNAAICPRKCSFRDLRTSYIRRARRSKAQ